MQTVVELPDELVERTREWTERHGTTFGAFVARAVERELAAQSGGAEPDEYRMKLPLFHIGDGKPLDLSGFDFDDLLNLI